MLSHGHTQQDVYRLRRHHKLQDVILRFQQTKHIRFTIYWGQTAAIPTYDKPRKC